MITDVSPGLFCHDWLFPLLYSALLYSYSHLVLDFVCLFFFYSCCPFLLLSITAKPSNRTANGDLSSEQMKGNAMNAAKILLPVAACLFLLLRCSSLLGVCLLILLLLHCFFIVCISLFILLDCFVMTDFFLFCIQHFCIRAKILLPVAACAIIIAVIISYMGSQKKVDTVVLNDEDQTWCLPDSSYCYPLSHSPSLVRCSWHRLIPPHF